MASAIASVEERLDMFGQYPLDVVLDNLALDIPAMNGSRVLDLGCGATANLVRYLREKGVDAEGLDSEFDDNVVHGHRKIPYLMRAEASAIPRPDEHYSAVISHYAAFIPGTVRYASKFAREIERRIPLKERTTDVQEFQAQERILQEALRVLNEGGKLIITPLPDYLLRQSRSFLKQQGIARDVQRVQSAMAAEVVEQQDKTGYEALYRLVLAKSKSR